MSEPAIKDQIDAIIRTLKGRGSSPPLIEETSALARAHPEAVLALAQAIIRRAPADRELLSASLSFLPEGDWGELIEFALDAFDESNDNQAADFVLLVASWQALPALYPHLERYFWRKVKAYWQLDVKPWRD